MAGLRERASETFESWLQAVARVSDAPVAPALPPLVPGAQLAGGRFTVGRALGQGGMGAVYEAHDAQLDALVALKTLAAGNPELLLRLKGEFRSLQDLHHPNLVTLGELHEDRGRWFFTMERIHGVDFLAHLRGERPHAPPDLPRLRAAFLGLTRGLRALHRAGKVHRDVKPSNVLVGEDGRVVLLDFGLVTERRAAGEGGRGEIVGTVAYMAPEQAAGATPGPAADWYAAGVMLHEALTGRLPVSGSRDEVLAAKGAPPPALPPDVPQDLAELCRRLLAPDPKERATGSDVLRVVAPFRVEPGTTPARFDVGFVGRTNELRTLEELFLGARLGQPAVVHLVGEPGIGKSALLRQLAARLGMIRSTVVLEGRCRAREHVPFRGIDGVVDALAAALRRMDDAERRELVPPRLGVLRDTFPVLGAFGAAEAEPIPEPRERRREVFALLRELLARLAERRPVAVLIDDLHWADADSLAALEAMLRPPEAPPVFWIMASREAPPERAGAPLFPRARVLGLEPLGEEHALALARDVAARRGRPAPDPARLLAETGGHPLFIEELARGGGGRLEEALAERIGALGALERRVLELLALGRHPLAREELARAAGEGVDPVARSLHGLEAEHLSRHLDSGFEPFHEHVREAVLRRLSAEARAAAHRRLAEALGPEGPPESRAHHWHGAGDDARAYALAREAADAARDALAFDRAARLYGWALELGRPAGEERAALLRERGDALVHTGRGAEAAAAYGEAAGHAAPRARADLARREAEQLLRAGHIDEGLEAMERVLADIGLHAPPRALIVPTLVKERAALRWALRKPPRAPRGSFSPEALRRLDTCWAVAIGLSQVDPVPGSFYQARYARLALETGEPGRIALALAMEAVPAASSGPPGLRAERLLALAHEMAQGVDAPHVTGYLALAEAGVAFLTGRWSTALHNGDEAVTIFRTRCTGVSWELATALRFSLTCLWHMGRVRDLLERTDEALREARVRADRYALTQLQTTILPVTRLMRDDPDGAEADLEEALASWSKHRTSLQHWQHGQARGLWRLYRREAGVGLAELDASLPRIDRAFLSRIAAIRIFSLALRGLIGVAAAAWGQGDRRALLKGAKRDTAKLAKEGFASHMVAFLEGQIAHLEGRRSRAIERLARAARGFTERDMRLYDAVARRSRGLLLGGAEGERLVQEAEAWMASQGIAEPVRFAAVLAPAFA